MRQESMQLLVSLGRVLVGKGIKALQPFAPLVPYGSVVLEVAQETWEDYTRHVAQGPAPNAPGSGVPGKGEPVPPATVPSRVEIDLRVELESLVRATPAAARQQAEHVTEQVAGDQPPEVRQALADYLAQVPAMLRRGMRRPSDPTGTSVPGNLLLRNGEDLVALLPPRRSRFKSGDRPLPGVDWVLDDLLGVGAFGEVWKAHHAQLKGLPPVALKFCLDEQAAEALRNEAGVLDQVMQHMQQGRHEGIVQLRQAYLQAATPCLEYEYIAGGDLAGLIQELHHKGRPSTDMTGKIMRRLAGIIGTVHQQRPPIVHRDLKPANILVQKTSAGKFQFKVADFGVGQVATLGASQTSTRGGERLSGLLTTRVRGSYTPLYASPQQVRGDPADPRDDVYSLGVIWYQLLTGELGSGAPSGMRWSRDLAQGGMPQSQIDLLASCLESNPSYRPANAAVLAEQLSPAQAESALLPKPIPAPPGPMGEVKPQFAEVLKDHLTFEEQIKADAAACEACIADGRNSKSYLLANFQQRLGAWQRYAEQGTAEAQWLYGDCLLEGIGLSKDPAEAAEWFRKAADQGFALAQMSLANRYYRGEGVRKDIGKAIHWYRKAAAQGQPSAISILNQLDKKQGDPPETTLPLEQNPPNFRKKWWKLW